MARDYEATTVIDTIVCMEGCEIIGAYLAQELTKGGVLCEPASDDLHHDT